MSGKLGAYCGEVPTLMAYFANVAMGVFQRNEGIGTRDTDTREVCVMQIPLPSTFAFPLPTRLQVRMLGGWVFPDVTSGVVAYANPLGWAIG